MQVLRQLAALPANTAACIGAFDGFHLGHQALLRRADTLEPTLAVVTFDPHPARVLAPERAPQLLQTAQQRERVCADLGVDLLVLLPFDRAVASMSPRAFVERMLIDGLRPASVVVGPDFRFGAKRSGGIPELRALLSEAGIAVAVADEIPHPSDDEGDDEGAAATPTRKLSSTGIREAVRAGAVGDILPMLGRFYAVCGAVVRGAMRGRGLGFPTANVRTPNALLPRAGVYAATLALLETDATPSGVRARVARRWPAVANLGTNPTFTGSGDDADASPLSLEVHALDVDLGDSLYGREVEVSFVRRLRDEQRFAGPDALRAQIVRDASDARALLTDAALAQTTARPLRAPRTRTAS